MVVYSIVVTYNGEKWIRKCLDSLYKSDQPPQVIIVDNNSTDKTVEIIQSEYSFAFLEICPHNIGFGRANNIGIKKALADGAQYILLLNQDAWIEPDTIEKLIKIQKENAEYGVLSPIHLNGVGNKMDQKFNEYLRREQGKDLLNDLLSVNAQLKNIYPFHFVNAAGWLISKRCLERVGGFDPLFTHYGEDNDYLNRCFYHGFKLGVVPSTYIYHDRGNDVKLLDKPICVDNLYVTFLKYLKVIDSNFVRRYRTFEVILLKGIVLNLISGNFSKAIMYYKAWRRVNGNKTEIKKHIIISMNGRAFI